MFDKVAENNYAAGTFVGENSEPLLCRLEDGIIFKTGQSMIIFRRDPLLRQASEIIGSVLEAGLYNYWISGLMHSFKLGSHKIAIVHQFDEYYSFNLYHMQPAFSLLLLGWFLSAICFMFEVLYNRVLGKWFEVFSGWLATLFFIMAGLHSST